MKHPIEIGRSGPQGQIMNPYCYFIYGLVLQIRPLNVLEIGLGARSYTALHILEAFQTYKERSKHSSFEIAPHYYVIDSDDQGAERFLREYAGDYTYIHGDAQTESPYKNVPENMDLICIDGEHSTVAVIMNVQFCLRKAKKDTIFVFHDATHDPIKKGFEHIKRNGMLKIISLDAINVGIGTIV
jgi:hypothetical protein